MSQGDVPLPQLAAGRRGFGATSRTDAWWLQPLLVFLGLSAFVVYSTWAALQGADYYYKGGGADYLSPFYSPVLFDSRSVVEAGLASGHAWFGAWPAWWPAWLPATPALLILWAPAGFRFTCYYYRGAYYKAFWADPPSCGVGEPRTGYRGEHTFPLLLQNVHRYFMYIALLFIVILGYDAWRGLWFLDDPAVPASGRHFGIHLGSLVLILNVVLLGGYTLGCHSLRHLVGGRFDLLSKHAGRYRAYRCVSCLNRGHMRWAWFSLFWVGFTDVYVRLCATGAIHDLRIFG